jgi:CxxC motif-containing protein (DUF1111 family)
VRRPPPSLTSIAHGSEIVGRTAVIALSAVLALMAGCGDGHRDDGPAAIPTPAQLRAQGGDATIESIGRDAFAQSVPGLSDADRTTFAIGNNFFNDNWVTAPSSTEGRDGVGPIFNAQSCSSCHLKDGRGQPPSSEDDPVRGLLLRLSVAGPDEGTVPHPVYGDQLQDRATRGLQPEGRIVISTVERTGHYGDGTTYTLAAPTYEIIGSDGRPFADDVLVSPRLAPPVFGVGLLEAVPAKVIVAAADPHDADGDGISGRANMVVDPTSGKEVLGRFGWKAAVPSVEAQNAAAFDGDIGITSSRHRAQPCTDQEPACLAQPDGGDPEVGDRKLGQVTFYTRTLAVPARRDVGRTETGRGQATFSSLGCADCHSPELRTGSSRITQLAHQTIRPYTDLLVHDMGPALADDRPDGQATGREWRTPPLWGIGLVETVNGHTRFLHDGRARNLTEAILWHGGEATQARDAFRDLPAADRADLLAFLESL